jgi:hypothetical protein
MALHKDDRVSINTGRPALQDCAVSKVIMPGNCISCGAQ